MKVEALFKRLKLNEALELDSPNLWNMQILLDKERWTSARSDYCRGRDSNPHSFAGSGF